MKEGVYAQNFDKDPAHDLKRKVAELLTNERFHIDEADRKLFERQVRSDKRFVCVVGQHEEADGTVERFLKIPVGPEEEIDEPFQRQVLITKFLEETGAIKTRGVIKYNFDRSSGQPFAIMETFRKGEAKIGFIAGHDDMELLTAKEAESTIDNLEALQSINLYTASPEVRDILQKIEYDYEGLSAGIKENIRERITALDSPPDGEEYHEVLNRRLRVENFKEKVDRLIEHWRQVLSAEDNKGKYLMHGDLAPGNMYIYDNGEVEFVDWEWAGVANNKAIATIIDYGNCRARAWNNPEYREALDNALIERYQRRGQENLGRAIVSLGILRSHMGLAGFFENYDLETQRKESERRRRESTEADIKRAWEVAGLEF